jgi:hypothetical protein
MFCQQRAVHYIENILVANEFSSVFRQVFSSLVIGSAPLRAVFLHSIRAIEIARLTPKSQRHLPGRK